MPHIEKAGYDSIEIIRSLARDTWIVCYREMISPEQIQYMLEMMYHPDSLKKQMEDGHQFFIIKMNGKSCGFCSCSPADNTSLSFRLHKLYVLPEEQGKGLGKLLLDKTIEQAKSAGAGFLELNVNRNNTSLPFYIHEGFEVKESVDLDIGGGYFMNDYIMQKKI